MLKLSCGETWTVCLQSPRDGPGMSGYLVAEALPPPGFWSIIDIWAETRLHWATAPRPESAQMGARALPSQHRLWVWTTRSTRHLFSTRELYRRCHTHTEAGMRPSSFHVHRPPHRRGRGLFPQSSQQALPRVCSWAS